MKLSAERFEAGLVVDVAGAVEGLKILIAEGLRALFALLSVGGGAHGSEASAGLSELALAFEGDWSLAEHPVRLVL